MDQSKIIRTWRIFKLTVLQKILNSYLGKLQFRKSFTGQVSETLTREQIGMLIAEISKEQISKNTLPENFEIFIFHPFPQSKPSEETVPEDEYLVKAEIGKSKITTYTTASWIDKQFIGVDNSFIISYAKLPTGGTNDNQ